jgi:hypothetical protein
MTRSTTAVSFLNWPEFAMCKKKIWFGAAVSLAVLYTGLCVGRARAGTITFDTPVGATVEAGLPVDAEAVFVTSTDTLTITLTNLLSIPEDVGQNLSDLGFTVSTGQTAGTLTNSSGVERTIDANGSYTIGSVISTGWQLSTGAAFKLDVLAPGGAGPTHLIIGGPDSTGFYSNANGSIAGNKAHNPFLAGDVTFTLNIPGLTNASSISSVFFSLGSVEGINVPGVSVTDVSVPEPASISILASGMVGMAGFAFRRQRRTTKE